jgi:hypothetical protein
MKLRSYFSSILVLTALLVSVGVLIGTPGRDANKDETLLLPVYQPGLGRDEASEVIFEEDFEGDVAEWSTADLTNTETFWHRSNFLGENEDDGLWWCGDTLTGYADQYIGYENMLLQYLDSPVLNLSQAGNNLRLTFRAYWLLEDPRRVPPPQGWDGWDGWMVLISTNNGQSFEVIRPISPAYTAEHLSACERYWGLQGSWPGWVFESSPNGREGWEAANDTVITPEWVNCSFDLSEYRDEQVVVRFMLASDRTVAAPFNYYLRNSGVLVDDILIGDANERIFLSNDGTNDPEPGEMIPRRGPGFGDHWELTEENAHSGNASMHNDDDFFNLTNVLDSPPFDVPEDFNTHLEFWVRCDLPDAVHQGAQTLSDFYQIYVSPDDGETWTYLTHDYNRPEAGGDDWTHYVPGVPFTGNLDLSLTDYAGQTVQLRWMFRTDGDHREGNGSGLFIDDIEVIAESRQPRDAAFEDVYIPYPTTVRTRLLDVTATMINYGTSDLSQIWSYWGWTDGGDHNREYRIIPNPSLPSGDSLVVDITDYADRRVPGWTPLVPGVFTVYARTAVGSATPGDPGDDDQYTPNDSTALDGVRVWPVGLIELGYDNRTYQFAYNFDRGTGAATRFSPGDAGLNEFSIASAHFLFNGAQEDVETFVLHILADNQGDPGREIYQQEVEVPPDSCLPRGMTVHLGANDALRGLSGDFWFWAEVLGDNNRPQIIGDEARRGDTHFYNYDGQNAVPFNADFNMHAMVVPAGNVAPNVVETDQLLDFGEVVINRTATKQFALYSTGLTPLTIRRITLTNDNFGVEFPGETTLRTGEALHFAITFTPPDDQVHAADMVIESNDETPPAVTIVGSGTASVDDDPSMPIEFGIQSAYPNPFNNTSRIEFALESGAMVRISLFNLAGQEVAKIASGVYPRGSNTASLQGDQLPAGLYVVKMESAGRTSSQKVLLLK